jgi:hypothetical protein
MLLEHFAYLRTLPVEERRRRAALYAGVATGCIVLIWGSVLYFGKSGYLDVTKTEGSRAIMPPPLPDVSGAASEVWNSIPAAEVPSTSNIDVGTTTQSSVPGAVGVPPTGTSSLQTTGVVGSTTASTSDTTFVQSILQEVKP